MYGLVCVHTCTHTYIYLSIAISSYIDILYIVCVCVDQIHAQFCEVKLIYF